MGRSPMRQGCVLLGQSARSSGAGVQGPCSRGGHPLAAGGVVPHLVRAVSVKCDPLYREFPGQLGMIALDFG
jgi:hypothetical protein